MSSDPEKELQDFLSSKPQWVQTALQQGTSRLTREELLQRWERDEWYSDLVEQYEQILQRIPEKFRAYQSRDRRDLIAAFAPFLPKGKSGRPKKDALRIEAEQLKSTGLSWAQIARRLNQMHGRETVTPESVRKLVSRTSRPPAPAPTPDKTQS